MVEKLYHKETGTKRILYTGNSDMKFHWTEPENYREHRKMRSNFDENTTAIYG